MGTFIQAQDTVTKRLRMKFIDPKWIRTSLLVVFAFPYIYCAAYSQKKASAESFLVELYSQYQSPAGPDFLGKAADTLFTPALLHLIRKEQQQPQGNVGILDFDPLCDCQDFEISDFHVRTRVSDQKDILAEVTFKNFGSEVRLDLTLKKVVSRWKIADIHSKSVPSLYHVLKSHQK